MRLSIAVTNYSWPGGPPAIASRLVELARTVDGAGLDTLWVADHLLQMDPNAGIDEPMLEAYTTLGFLAATTASLRLGTMVTWATIRPPALLIKMVTTLDVLSGGRAWLGVGAGYQADEAALTGLTFETTRERFICLEELLQLAAHTWDGDRTAFHGPRHHVDAPLNSPAPVARPRVLVGGMGEQRTLPLVARYADACNLFDIPDGDATLRHKLDVLNRACDAVDRDPTTLEVTLSSRLGPEETVDEFVDRCGHLTNEGVDHVVLVTTGPWTPGSALDVALDAAPSIRRISPTARA
jgi:alkanesulfonate monooxygenase SsuD/methylene tetrahydromethanopterin reductase-like flavin-dependent oxidoreductase (luciferase family)